MSDHISGPRALAEPIADITDLYAFPSPERPGHLVLVMNTLPFAQPSDCFSDGLVYRFRLRPLVPSSGGAPFAAADREFVFDCVFSAAVDRATAQRRRPGGDVHDPGGRHRALSACTTSGRPAHGVRVFAGPRWDPFIMDAPAALKTIATGEMAFTDPELDLPRRQERPQPGRRARHRAAGGRRAGRCRRGDADPRAPQRCGSNGSGARR